MENNSSPSPWRRISSSLETDCRIFQVMKKRFEHPVRNTEADFYVIDSNDWVVVVAETAEKELVLVRQFRFGIEDFSLEPPGGVLDKGEEPVEAGLRELLEETGYTSSDVEMMGWIHPNPPIMSNRCHYLLARNAKKTATPEWDEHEELETVLLPVSELKNLLLKGAITHSIALGALSMYLLYTETRTET